MTYRHLTYSDRTKISALLQLGIKIPDIAKELKRPRSTVYRELIRNSHEGFYFVDTAQILSDLRRSSASQERDDDEELWTKAVSALKHGMSPKQVEGRMKSEGTEFLSASTIYRRIKEDQIADGNVWTYLRRSHKTYRRSFTIPEDHRNEIKNRVSIDERPEKVEYRERLGDLEGDTMVGPRNKSAILTMNDRVSKKVVIEKLANKQSRHVCKVMIKAARKFPGKKHTCTLDNGKEFAAHEDFTDATDIQVYFCNPRTPEQRGSNENTNGLIRQYFPKGTDLNTVPRMKLKKVEYKLNSRPRKSLGYLTPFEAETGGKIQFHFFS